MSTSLRLLGESSLGIPGGDAYIYSLVPCGTDALAAISSDNSLRCFDRRTLQLLPGGVVNSIHTGSGDASGVTCLSQCSNGSGAPNVLATSGRDGTIKVWDIRAEKTDSVASFSTENNYPLTALSFNPETHSLAAGTELVSSQAFVAFWDIRSPGQPNQRFVESHNDDVTELQFHPTRNNVVLSGSTDGLVNIYDTTITDEDDALLQVIKHGSIHHAGFLGAETVFALSHDEAFSIHPLTNPDDESASLLSPAPVHFGDLRPGLECNYIVQVLSSQTGTFVASGNTSDKTVDLVPIIPGPQFSFQIDKSRAWRLPGAHGEEIVRSVHLEEQTETVFTCGEDGLVRAWKNESGSSEGQKDSLPSKHHKPTDPTSSSSSQRPKKDKKHKEKRGFKPY